MLNWWRRDWKTESWIWRDEACEARRVEPWVAYWEVVIAEREKALRPGARRVGFVMAVSLWSVLRLAQLAHVVYHRVALGGLRMRWLMIFDMLICM